LPARIASVICSQVDERDLERQPRVAQRQQRLLPTGPVRQRRDLLGVHQDHLGLSEVRRDQRRRADRIITSSHSSTGARLSLTRISAACRHA
jgi:hypothetical protein